MEAKQDPGWLAMEMCGYSDQALCAPQLRGPLWLKLRAGDGIVRDLEREALRPKKGVDQPRAGAQGDFRGDSDCVVSPQFNMQWADTFSKYVALPSFLWGSARRNPCSPEAKATHLGW